jgi:hypothetical protein
MRQRRSLRIFWYDFYLFQEIEETVYGEKSVEVAKTLKLLGTVSMSQNQLKKA